MKMRFVIACVICILSHMSAQVQSVQLKIKEKSGFLGMGGPRIVQIDLSNQNHQPTTVDNVHAGQAWTGIHFHLDDDAVQANHCTGIDAR